jgi:site-specific DNA-methyltransferase (adenine-specific)
MAERASFLLRGRNPDVLTCIANLSNDEVFTPPELANAMLDRLADQWAAANDGTSIWADGRVTFLDPVTKTGVFLREITKRLIDGLKREIPDLDDRVDHILTKQVFGIGITQLTSLLARRTVYCSKDGAGRRSSRELPHGSGSPTATSVFAADSRRRTDHPSCSLGRHGHRELAVG